MNKLKQITKRALEIREKGGFKTETITKKRYNVAYIPDAIKQAAKELKKSEPAPAKATKTITIKKAQKARSENSLSKLIRMSDGRVLTKKQFVEQLISDGAMPGFEMVNKIKDMSRMASFRADQKTQDAHDRKQREAGKIPEYFLKRKDGVYSTISKTEYDYAITLTKKRTKRVVSANIKAAAKNRSNKKKPAETPVKRTTRKVVASKLKPRPKMEMAKPIKIGTRKKGSRKLAISKFVKVRQGDTFTERYKVSAIKLYEVMQLDKYKYIPTIPGVFKLHFHKVVEKSEYPLFLSLFIKELSEGGKSLTGKQRIHVDELYGVTFTGIKTKMPARLKAGAYGLTDIVGKDALRPTMDGVYFESGFVYATDGHTLIRILDVDDLGKKYNEQILGIRKKDMNQVIDGKYPNAKALIDGKYSIKLATGIDVDDLLLRLNGINLIAKNIDYYFKENVGARIRLQFNNPYSSDIIEKHFDCKRITNALSVLRANGCKKIDIMVNDEKSSAGLFIDGLNECKALIMPISVSDELQFSIFEPIKL